MNYINNLGEFDSLADVWKEYPHGGKEGDYVVVDGKQIAWNKYTSNWGEDTQMPGVNDEVYGDLFVSGDLRVGGDVINKDLQWIKDATVLNKGYFKTVDDLKRSYPAATAGSKAYVGSDYPYAIYLWDGKNAAWVDSGEYFDDSLRNKGYFATVEALQAAYPIAVSGSKAYVGVTYPFAIYLWDAATSAWMDSGETGGEESVNLGDYYTKEETDAKVAGLESEVNGNYITGKSVGRLGLEYDNVGWNCTDFIPYSGGDIEWTYGESTSNQQIALCTYDSDKNFIDKFLASDSSGKRTITSDKKELIGAAYIRASFNDSVINENVIVMDGYTFVLSKGIIYNVVKNEEDIKKINSKSNSYDNSILIYSEYVDNDGHFHQSPSGSIRSGFIAVSKGSVVSIQSVNSSDTNIVSFYSSESEESYIDGIANTTNNCTYNVPQDGYIVVCSSKANIDKFSMTYVEPRGISDRVALLEQSIPTKDVVIIYKSEILTYSEYVDNDGVFHPSTAGSIRSGFIKVSKGDTVEVDSSNTEDTNKISLYSSQDESTYIVGVKNYKGKLIYDVPRNGYIVVCSSRSYNENFRLTHRTKLTINDRVTLLEDGVEVSNNAKPLNIPIFEPTNVTEAFTCDVGYDKAYINTDHQTFLSEYYDKYAFKTYDNYSVGKYTLGMDAAQDGHEIFCYEFAPKKHSKTVLLSSGMNCCELAPILGVAYFIKSLMEDYQNDEGLKWMRENVRFVVIPFICPSSFDVVPCRYTNANDVRINKNFNYRKSWFSMGNFAGLPGTKGDAPDSEIETKLLKQWISSYRGANLWIDCHADLSIDQPYKLIEVFYSDSNTGTKVKSTFNKIKQFYVDKGYISDPSSVVMNGSQEVNTFPKTLYSYNEIGIPALMIEQWALSVVYGSDPTKQCDSYAIKNYVTMLHQYIMACL